MGRRNRSRSASSNTASPPATRRPISPTSSSIRSRAAARRPIGRSGSRSPAAALGRSATTRSRASRCRRSTNIGTSDGHNAVSGGRRRRWCSSRSPASGTGTRGRSRPSRCSPSQWGDAGDWQTGDWIGGRGPALPPVGALAGAGAGALSRASRRSRRLGWSTHVRPRFGTDIADHVSGRSSRRPRYASAYYDVELTYDLLRADARRFSRCRRSPASSSRSAGAATPFWIAPPGLAERRRADPRRRRRRDDDAFALVRSFGTYAEPVAGTSGVAAVYLNGVAPPELGPGRVPAATRLRSSFATRPPPASSSPPTSASCGSAASPTTRSISRSSWRCCSHSRTVKLTTVRP